MTYRSKNGVQPHKIGVGRSGAERTPARVSGWQRYYRCVMIILIMQEEVRYQVSRIFFFG